MTAHFSRKECVGFPHFLFYQGVTGRCHDRNATVFFDILIQVLRTFNFSYNGCTRISRKNISCKNCQQLITP